MKNLAKYILLLVCIGSFSACEKLETAAPVQEETVPLDYNRQHPLAPQFQTILDKAAKAGLPGISLAVKTADGYWTGSAGYASIEKKHPMQPSHLQYAQSITKVYLAALTLKLVEQQRLNLDTPIQAYLPQHIEDMLTETDKITLKMLLNHTSGLKDYAEELDYISFFLNNPVYTFKPIDYLGYIKGKKNNFTPGTEYSYSNTNYLVLSLLLNNLDSRGHAKLLQELILEPLQLQYTYYKSSNNYLQTPQLVNSYWDRFSNGKIENVTLQQRVNVATLNGDDGLVATPLDFARFMDGLLHSPLLSAQSKALMQEWYLDDKGEKKAGLGFEAFKLNNKFAFGHSGAGLGAGSGLYYFPENGVIVFVATNIGTLTSSPLHKAGEDAQEELFELLAP